MLAMGMTGRPHGIKGEIGVNWHGEYIPRPGDTVYLQKPKGDILPYEVANVRQHKGRLLLTLVGVIDRNGAEALKDMPVLLPRDAVAQPGEDEAFLADLPGCRVFLENGEPLGVIDHLEMPAGQLVWAIKDATAREILFPATPEFIHKLDMQKREAIIAPPPGLLDIYRA